MDNKIASNTGKRPGNNAGSKNNRKKSSDRLGKVEDRRNRRIVPVQGFKDRKDEGAKHGDQAPGKSVQNLLGEELQRADSEGKDRLREQALKDPIFAWYKLSEALQGMQQELEKNMRKDLVRTGLTLLGAQLVVEGGLVMQQSMAMTKAQLAINKGRETKNPIAG